MVVEAFCQERRAGPEPLALVEPHAVTPERDGFADVGGHQMDMPDVGILLVSFGRSLRREGLQRKNILVLQEQGTALPRPRAITNTREPFHVACKELADDPPPAVASEDRWVEVQRERLRSILDRQAATPAATLRRVPDLSTFAVRRQHPRARHLER